VSLPRRTAVTFEAGHTAGIRYSPLEGAHVPNKLFAVIYRYGTDSAAMNVHRLAHKAYLGTLFERGSIVSSGPLASSFGASALLIMRAENESEIETLLDVDPFATEGLINRREIAEWTIVYDSVGVAFDRD
jgi:uncharacterized protein YciI